MTAYMVSCRNWLLRIEREALETTPEANLLQAVSEKTRSDPVLIGFFEFAIEG
jgi:hypothetical protein